jgi:hypothetical protein
VQPTTHLGPDQANVLLLLFPDGRLVHPSGQQERWTDSFGKLAMSPWILSRRIKQQQGKSHMLLNGQIYTQSEERVDLHTSAEAILFKLKPLAKAKDYASFIFWPENHIPSLQEVSANLKATGRIEKAHDVHGTFPVYISIPFTEV